MSWMHPGEIANGCRHRVGTVLGKGALLSDPVAVAVIMALILWLLLGGCA